MIVLLATIVAVVVMSAAVAVVGAVVSIIGAAIAVVTAHDLNPNLSKTEQRSGNISLMVATKPVFNNVFV